MINEVELVGFFFLIIPQNNGEKYKQTKIKMEKNKQTKIISNS